MAESSARYQSYDGAELAYRVLGSDGASAPDGAVPLVALAGGPGRDAAYLGDLGGLAADRPVVVPDMRGTGDSRSAGADPSCYAFPRLAEDVEALRRELGLQRIALLGHSAGATTAQAYAARHPERLSHLVLVAPGTRLQGRPTEDAERIFRSRSAESWYQDAIDAVAGLDQAQSLGEVRELLLRAAPAVYGEWGPAQQAHAEAEGGQLNPVPRAAFWQGVDHGTRLTLLDGLRQLTAPVMIVTGERDGLAGVDAGDLVAASFPEGGTTHRPIPGAGHYPWVDRPDVFRELVNRFLSGTL